MLGHPTLTSTQIGTDAQGQALLPQQHIAAITRTHGNDLIGFRKVADEAPVRMAVEETMQPPVERVRGSQMVDRNPAHPGHDPHVENHIERVGQFNAHLRQRGSRWSHQVRNHVQRAPFHAAASQAHEFRPHGRGIGPVVCRSSVFGQLRTNEGAVFDASHVVGVGAVVVASRHLLLIERREDPLPHRFGIEKLLFTL